MKKQKVIAVTTALTIFSFSFLGLVQFPGVVDKSCSLVKNAIPYPGKTVIAINNFLKKYPCNTVPQNKKAQKPADERNKFSGMIFYILSTLLVCNEKMLILLVIALAVMSMGLFAKSKLIKKEVYVPPDIDYYRRWWMKFITPLEKCIEYLATKYDMNPILIRGRGMSDTLKRPALCFMENRVRVFFMYVSSDMFFLSLRIIILARPYAWAGRL